MFNNNRREKLRRAQLLLLECNRSKSRLPQGKLCKEANSLSIRQKLPRKSDKESKFHIIINMLWSLNSLEVSLRLFQRMNAKSSKKSRLAPTKAPLMISWSVSSFMLRASLTNMSFSSLLVLCLLLRTCSISLEISLRLVISQGATITSYASPSQSLRPTTSGRFPTLTSKCLVISRVHCASAVPQTPLMHPSTSKYSMRTTRVCPKGPKTSSSRSRTSTRRSSSKSKMRCTSWTTKSIRSSARLMC